MTQLTVPATIRWADVEKCRKLSGSINENHTVINDESFSPHTIEYTGFGGTKGEMCEGVHTFKVVAFEEGQAHPPAIDFNRIPGLGDDHGDSVHRTAADDEGAVSEVQSAAGLREQEEGGN